MKHTTQRHAEARPRPVESVWRTWLEGNRAYGDAFERWAHPTTRLR